MKKRIISLLLIIVMLLPSSMIVHAEDSSIVVLYTNDVHCAIDDYAVLAAYRAELLAAGNAVITVDAGDAIQGEVIGTQTEGLAVVDIMNAVGYDYAVPGNHEFDYGMEAFLDLANNKAQYEYISSNFYYLPTVSSVFKPYSIKTVNGKDIAFVGITTPETVSKSTPSFFKDENGNFVYGFPTWDMQEGVLFENVQESVDNALAEGADIVIAVGHLGIAETTEGWKSTDIIANTTGIDYFIDAHSHETFVSSTYKNKNGEDVVLTSTGTKFANFGALTIESNGTISFELISPESVDINALSADGKAAYTTVKEKVDGYNAQIEELYGAIGSSEAELVVYDTDNSWLVRKQETNMGDFVADAYRAVTGADVAICNGGGVRSEISVGDVNKKMLMDINPWSNAMCVVEITGEQLLHALEHGARACPESLGGFFQISGASYEIHAYNESPVLTDMNGNFTGIAEGKELRVQNVLVNGEPLDMSKKYTVAGSQYVLTEGGDGLTMLEGATVVQKDGLFCDSEMLIKYFTETLGGVITSEQYGNPNGDGRITIYGFDKCKIKLGETITVRAFEIDDENVTRVTFVPEESGYYCLESFARNYYDLVCTLYEEGNDEMLYSNDDSFHRDFSLEYYFEAGKTYYFVIQSYNEANNSIEITLRCAHSYENGVCVYCEEECDHSIDVNVGSCACGKPYSYEALKTDTEYEYDAGKTNGKYVIYSFVPNETSMYSVSAYNGTRDSFIFLYNENGDSVLQADDTDESLEYKLKYMLLEGKTYYLLICDYYEDGAHNFVLKNENYLLGDLNGDGEVNNIDAATVLRYDAGIIDLDDAALSLADINNDGEVNNIDAATMLRYDAGIIDWDNIV